MTRTRIIAMGAVAASAAIAAGLSAPAIAESRHGGDDHRGNAGYGTTRAGTQLTALNRSGATGAATVKLSGRSVTVSLYAKRLLAKMPHAMHIHAGGMGTCPTMAHDANNDGILSTTEGHHAYGSIAASLTTRGDVSPASGLAITRYPTAPNGVVAYQRTFPVSATLAAQIRRNNAVVVVHGIDPNGSGAYDGKAVSDLDPKLPLEATSPALCGALRVSSN